MRNETYVDENYKRSLNLKCCQCNIIQKNYFEFLEVAMKFNGTFIGVKTSKVTNLELDDIYMGEGMKKGASLVRVKVLPRTTFST